MSYNPYQFNNPYQQMYGQPMPDQLQQYRQPYQMQNQPVQQQIQPQYQAQQNNVGYIVVNNENEAVNWIVAPNCSVIMMHASLPIMYLKKADASGKCELETYDKRTRTEPQQTANIPVGDFITREEFQPFADALSALTSKSGGKYTKKEETVNE